MRKNDAPTTRGRLAAVLAMFAMLACLAALPAWAQQKAAPAQKADVGAKREDAPQSVNLSGSPSPQQSGQTSESSGAGGRMAANVSTPIKQPADFNEAVRVALVQSPLLTRSALEIESKRLDVHDAWATFIPTISLNTTYWFRRPPSTDTSTNDKPLTISFSTGAWNPLLSGFDVKAKQEMTNIAVLAHLRVISEGIKRLAGDFLQLSMVAEQREISRKKQDLAKLNADFFKTRASMGHATQVELRIAETKYQLAKAEEEKIIAMRNIIMDDIKFILGIPFVTKLELDVKAAKQQILGKFTPADVTDDKVRNYSFDLRMAEYEKRLQQKNIALSYVRMLPTFGFTFQTVDALNQEQRNLEKGLPFYPGVTINLPLDYWTKGREVARQYKKLDQMAAGNRAKEYELMAGVQKAMSEYQSANSELTMAAAKTELTRLVDEQSEYRHKTGQVDFDKFATDRTDYLDNRQKMLVEQLKRDTSLLNLKHLTGDLQNQFIDVAAWEK